MNSFGNLVWLVFGGFIIAIEYFIASLLLCITIIGIPFGIQTMKIAALALWPFGNEIRETKRSTGFLSVTMNIIWIFVGGIWITLTHLAFAIIFGLTIIGIPIAQQHMKMAALSLTPFGREVVPRLRY